MKSFSLYLRPPASHDVCLYALIVVLICWCASAFAADTYTLRDGVYYSQSNVPHSYTNGCFTPIHSTPIHSTPRDHKYESHKYEPPKPTVLLEHKTTETITQHVDFDTLVADAARLSINYQGRVLLAREELAAQREQLLSRERTLKQLIGGSLITGYAPSPAGPAVYQGDTRYEVSHSDIQRKVFGAEPPDFTRLLSDYLRGGQNTSAAGAELQNRAGELIATHQDGYSRLQETLVNAEAAERSARAIRSVQEPQPRTETVERSTTITPERSSTSRAASQRSFPFLAKHCADCHGAESPAKGLRYDGSPINDAAFDQALTAIRSGKMPPKERPKLNGSTNGVIRELAKAAN